MSPNSFRPQILKISIWQPWHLRNKTRPCWSTSPGQPSPSLPPLRSKCLYSVYFPVNLQVKSQTWTHRYTIFPWEEILYTSCTSISTTWTVRLTIVPSPVVILLGPMPRWDPRKSLDALARVTREPLIYGRVVRPTVRSLWIIPSLLTRKCAWLA